MLVILLIVLLALVAIGALFLWWRYEMDLSDIAASSVTPAIGIWIIYSYGGPLAWAGGVLLLAIGAFALFFLLKRRDRQATRQGHYRDEA
ncbi:MAG: hypothetical protein QNJ62_05710 [Methyloceanibacter sp.]|nr:hypothetical protein [Methyloceanibacter sp.]